MISLKTLAVGCSLAGALCAQHVGVLNPQQPSALASPNAFPYGNILFPGGVPTNHASNLGATMNGRLPAQPPMGTGMGQGRGGGYGRGRTVVVPYGVPVYYGGGDYGYGYNYQQPASNVTVVIPQQPTPSVIINQNFVPETAHPVLRDYSEEPTESRSSGIKVYGGKPRAATDENTETQAPKVKAPAEDRPTIFLIAFTDSSVHSAIGYWVENGTLHYVTPQGTVNRISLTMVDRELSEQLNSERKVEFTLKN